MHSENTSPLLHIYSYLKISLLLCGFWITWSLQKNIPCIHCDCNVVSTSSTNTLIFSSIPHRILKKLGSTVLAVSLAFSLHHYELSFSSGTSKRLLERYQHCRVAQETTESFPPDPAGQRVSYAYSTVVAYKQSVLLPKFSLILPRSFSKTLWNGWGRILHSLFHL